MKAMIFKVSRACVGGRSGSTTGIADGLLAIIHFEPDDTEHDAKRLGRRVRALRRRISATMHLSSTDRSRGTLDLDILLVPSAALIRQRGCVSHGLPPHDARPAIAGLYKELTEQCGSGVHAADYEGMDVQFAVAPLPEGPMTEVIDSRRLLRAYRCAPAQTNRNNNHGAHQPPRVVFNATVHTVPREDRELCNCG